MTQALDPAALSSAIGLIYDCALHPEQWPSALATMTELREATLVGFTVVDPSTGYLRSNASAGLSDRALKDFDQTYAKLMPAPLLDITKMIVDEAHAVCDFMDYDEFWRSRFYREWAGPLGIVDGCSTCLMRSPTRFAMAMCLLPRVTTDRDRDLARLFAPHLRRAVTISDLIDAQGVVLQRMDGVVNSLSVGVVVTSGTANILYANQRAETLLSAASTIRSSGGKLDLRSPELTAALHATIAQAVKDEGGLGAAGIGIPASSFSGTAAALHVLPLERRSCSPFPEQPAVAVFVGGETHVPKVPSEILAAVYGLTPAEARVALNLSSGQTIAGLAAAAGVARSTAKTHLARVMSKMGARKQTEIVSAIQRLAVPVTRKEA